MRRLRGFIEHGVDREEVHDEHEEECGHVEGIEQVLREIALDSTDALRHRLLLHGTNELGDFEADGRRSPERSDARQVIRVDREQQGEAQVAYGVE